MIEQVLGDSEKLKYLVGIKLRKATPRAVITGTGRVGTHFLASLGTELAKNWRCVHEPQNDLYNQFREARISRVTDELVRNVVRHRAKHWLNAKLKSNGFLECNPFLAQSPELISSAMAGAKVAVVIREWQTCVASFSNLAVNGEHYFMAPHDYRPRISGVELGFFSQKEWNHLNRIEKIAFWWAEINHGLLKAAEKNEWRVVKFEDLFGEEKINVLRTLFDFLGVLDSSKFDSDKVRRINATNTSRQRSNSGASESIFTSNSVVDLVSNKLVLSRLEIVNCKLKNFA